jgi:hypothetical protein
VASQMKTEHVKSPRWQNEQPFPPSR